MGSGWIKDKQRVDKFESEIKRILGEHLIGTADIVRDQTEATDLLVLELRPFRIGCRVRTFDYLLRYPNQFTVRADRPSGMPSEMTKIVDGWGDYIFYGFADETDLSLAAWIIGDLRIFRGTLVRKSHLITNQFLQRNGDQSSRFYAWPLSEFPQEFIIARQHFFQSDAA